MRKYAFIFSLFSALLLISGCGPDGKEKPEKEENLQWRYANLFACNVMRSYYLWCGEIGPQLQTWEYSVEPMAKVREVRYKDAQGEDIDKWTMLTDDIDGLAGSAAGVDTSYGLGLNLFYYDEQKTVVCAVVQYTSADSPARLAGLKRGDVIVRIAGKTMTPENYSSVLYDDFLSAPSCRLTMSDGTEVSMSAREMYEDPVLLFKSFDCGGKKVGYLVYNRFTLDSWSRLIEAADFFKAEGVTELILDMRYNPGGYVLAEETLASLVAPEDDVNRGEVYETSVYNEAMGKLLGDSSICFQTEYSFSSGGHQYSYSTAGHNIGLKRIYAILTSESASASESLLVGLKPYLPVEIIGEKSGGKYCTGLLYPAEDWFEDVKDSFRGDDTYLIGKKHTENWGIYVMIARYADKYGQTPCMPDGFIPDVPAEDAPYERYELGDDRERLLRTALVRAGKTDFPEHGPVPSSYRSARAPRTRIPQQAEGYRIVIR